MVFNRQRSTESKGGERCPNTISSTGIKHGVYTLCNNRRNRASRIPLPLESLCICADIWHAFSQQYGQIDGWSTQSYPEVHIEPYRGGAKFTAIRGDVKITVLRHVFDEYSPSVYIFREGTKLNYSQHEIRARAVKNELIDLTIVQKWMKTCQERHRTSCWMPTKTNNQESQNFRLIDLDKFCLVRGKPHQEYFALSYVWGDSKSASTTLENVSNFEQPGVLKSLHLSAAILDAMTLVLNLGFRYLWVDALCIVQDDEQSKHIEMSRMDKIYHNAYLTIIAAAGKGADAGLPGVTRLRPRTKQIRIGSDLNNPWLTSQRPLESLIGGSNVTSSRSGSIWNTRGWTYQERILSRRKLFFLEDGVHYNCQCMTFMEDLCENDGYTRSFQMFDFDHFGDWPENQLTKAMPYRMKDSYNLNFLPFPSLDDYCTLVHEYSQRNLTHESDILNAFAGIITALDDVFPSGFWFGLPEMFFTACLLWQPETTITRRAPMGDTSHESYFPSWSWTGWVGAVSVESWYAGCDYVKESALLEYLAPALPRVLKTVNFRRLLDENTSKSGASGVIMDMSMIYRETQSKDWPPGWSSTATGQCAFKDFPEFSFRYPIPLKTTLGFHSGYQMTSADPRLVFSALSASFVLKPYKSPSPNPRIQNKSIASVFNIAKWCGIVQLHEHWPAFTESAYEFISVSQGEVKFNEDDNHGDFFEIDYIIKSKNRGKVLIDRFKYYYHNVLLIQWHKDVAYRVGLGRISAEEWSKTEPTYKDIILG